MACARFALVMLHPSYNPTIWYAEYATLQRHRREQDYEHNSKGHEAHVRLD